MNLLIHQKLKDNKHDSTSEAGRLPVQSQTMNPTSRSITPQTPYILKPFISPSPSLPLFTFFFTSLFPLHTGTLVVCVRACVCRLVLRNRNSVVIGSTCSSESPASLETCHFLCQGVEERQTGQRSERQERLKMRWWRGCGKGGRGVCVCDCESSCFFFRIRCFQQGAWLCWGRSDPGPTCWKFGRAPPGRRSNPA